MSRQGSEKKLTGDTNRSAAELTDAYTKVLDSNQGPVS